MSAAGRERAWFQGVEELYARPLHMTLPCAMIQNPEKLRAMDREYAQKWIGALSYQQALDIFTALWQEARTLNPDFPGDWRDDIAADIEVARAVNGLPPHA